MEKKINIWEILANYPQSDIRHPEHNNGQGDTVMGMEEIHEAMLEFGKQLLELAAENAKAIDIIHNWNTPTIVKESITNTINQIE